MSLQGAENIHLHRSEVSFHPGGHHPAHPVVMAQGTAVLLDLVDDAGLERPVFLHVVHSCDEDEIQVRSLGIEMRCVRHAYRPGPGLDELPHALMQAVQVVPRDPCLEGVDHDPVVVQVFAHVGVRVPSVLPSLGRESAQRHGAVRLADPPHVLRHVLRETLLPLGASDIEASLHGLEATEAHDLVQGRSLDPVELQPHVGLFRIRNAEHAGHAEFPLRDLPRGVHRRLPGGEQVAEVLPVLGQRA